nr:MAG TPA: hypothetical protein [Caudoviricetes sp.]
MAGVGKDNFSTIYRVLLLEKAIDCEELDRR